MKKKKECEEIDGKIKFVYTEKCDVCDLETKVLNQNYNDPEYYTEVYVQCLCGNYVFFELPVN